MDENNAATWYYMNAANKVVKMIYSNFCFSIYLLHHNIQMGLTAVMSHFNEQIEFDIII